MPSLRRALLASAFMLSAAPLAAAPASVRDAARVVKLADPQVSPDGRTVALVQTRADLDDDEYRSEIMLLDMARRQLRPLTRDRHHASSPRFSPDGGAVAFLAKDKDQVGQVFILPMSGGDALQLTHAKKDADVAQFAWSPDGSRIAYAAADPKPDLQGEDKHRDAFRVGNDDFTQTEKPRPTHVWIVDAQGGEPRRLTSGAWSLPSSLPPGPPSSPIQWTPDGAALIIVRQETPSTGDQYQSRIEVVDAASGATRFLTGAAGLEGYPLISPDGRTVAYWRNRDDKPWNFQDVWTAPIAGGPATDVSAGLDKNLYGTRWMPDGRLLVGGNDGTGVGLWMLDPHGEARRLNLAGVMPTNGYWMDLAVAGDGGVVFVGQTGTDPYELYLSAPGRPPVALTHVNDLSDLTLGRVEAVRWPGPEGRMLGGVVTYPPGDPGGRKRPLVLVIHGGPNGSSREKFNLFAQVLAARGFVVFEPNYRGSDDQGNAFFASIYQDAGQGPGEDVKSGIDFLIARGGIDAARIGVSGWSYGGFMTTWMLGHYDIFRAAVAGAAVTDFVDMYDVSDGNVTTSAQVGGSPYVGDGMEAYRRQSPITSVAKIKAPTLILCDTGDFRVPITQSFSLYRALKDNHVETEFWAIPTGGHFPADPIRQMDVSQRWADWLATRLGPSPTD